MPRLPHLLVGLASVQPVEQYAPLSEEVVKRPAHWASLFVLVTSCGMVIVPATTGLPVHPGPHRVIASSA